MANVVLLYSPLGLQVNKNSTISNADQWVASNQWIDVVSSTVKSIRYDVSSHRLLVEFIRRKPGPGVYVYPGVPDSVAKEMFNCNSLGGFCDQRLKPVYNPSGPFHRSSVP